MHRRRLLRANPFTQAVVFSTAAMRQRIPAPRIPHPPLSNSIRSDRRRVIQQKVPRSPQRVIRIRCLRHRRAGIEVIVVVTAWAAAAARGTTRRRRTATRTTIAVTAQPAVWTGRFAMTGDLTLAFAQASATIDVAVRVLIPVAAPIGRIAGRAIIGTRVIARTALRTAVTVEAATLSARIRMLQIAAAAAAVIRIWADWPWRVPGRLHMTRFAAFIAARVSTSGSARVATTAATLHIHRSAAGR
jgi:hypothetical protein